MQPMVDYKFARRCRIELGIANQVDVEKGDAISIPVTLATILDNADTNYGKIVEGSEIDEEEAPSDDDEPDHGPKLYTSSELNQLSMGKLRDIGDEYEVKDNKKDELVDKIIGAQCYNEYFLQELEEVDLGDIAKVFDLEFDGLLIESILDSQEDE